MTVLATVTAVKLFIINPVNQLPLTTNETGKCDRLSILENSAELVGGSTLPFHNLTKKIKENYCQLQN